MPIYDIQDVSRGNQPEIDDFIEVCPSVVTGVQPNGSFYIQAEDGGPWSGIYVWASDTGLGAGLQIGDRVTVKGAYTEFRELSEIYLTAPNSGVEVLFSGTPLEPEYIANPVRISTNTEVCEDKIDGPDAEAYEGVLVEVYDVTVNDTDPCEQGRFGIFEVTGGLLVDDVFGYSYVPVEGQFIRRLTGIMTYAFGEFRIHPRNDEEIQDRGAQIACQCEGDFYEGDRVEPNVNSPSGASGIGLGSTGTATCGTNEGEPVLLINWDNWNSGHKGNSLCACPSDVAPSPLELDSGWYINCDEVDIIY